MKIENNIPIDKFEEEILMKLVSISTDTAEKMAKDIPGEISNKLIKILRENKINQVIQK